MAIDFPRGWQISKSVPFEAHHEKCSYRIAHGGFLCDCDVIWKHPECLDKRFMYGAGGKIIKEYDENGIEIINQTIPANNREREKL